MVLFHQLIISPVSQMHAFAACSARRNPVPTQATIRAWWKTWCVLTSSLQRVLLYGCLKEEGEKREKISPISSEGHSTQDVNEENHWRSLWQKRRRSQMKAGPPVHQPPVWGGGGGGGGWKGERRVRLHLQSDFTGTWRHWLQKQGRRRGSCPHQKLEFWPAFPPKNLKLLSPVCVYRLQSDCEVSCPAQSLPALRRAE